VLYFLGMKTKQGLLKIQISKGFTLLELLVVLAMMGILAAIVVTYAQESGQQGRDAKRQADVRALQSAIELYKNKYGRYPAGCRGADVWSGQEGTAYACAGGSTQYIVGLAPEFIPVLPQEKKLNGTNSGYTYITNANGTVYKVMAMNTVEAETVSYNHPLKSCDIRPDSAGNLQNLGATGVDTSGWCTTATQAANEPPGAVTSYGAIPNCRTTIDSGNGRFERSYGGWGGYEPETAGANRAAQVRNTAITICR
jgi:prepilin-type N-terminal cleavage/methylation domain-containing protein